MVLLLYFFGRPLNKITANDSAPSTYWDVILIVSCLLSNWSSSVLTVLHPDILTDCLWSALRLLSLSPAVWCSSGRHELHASVRAVNHYRKATYLWPKTVRESH